MNKLDTILKDLEQYERDLVSEARVIEKPY